MKYSFPLKRFSCKPTAVLATVFFIFNRIFIPTSFANGNELTLNEAQRSVPTLTLEQANAQTSVTQNAIPSGSAIAESSPLSLSTSYNIQSAETTVAGGPISYSPGLSSADVTTLPTAPHPLTIMITVSSRRSGLSHRMRTAWNRLSFDMEGYLTGVTYVGTSGMGLGAALMMR